MIIVLDTGVLGTLCFRGAHEPVLSCQAWLQRIIQTGHIIAVPEIVDYELRRELLRIRKTSGIMALDQLIAQAIYFPITTTDMRQSAALWALSRRQGRVSAHEHALDGDVILAAQTISLEERGRRCIVATTNVRHLNWFVDARTWESTDPAALPE